MVDEDFLKKMLSRLEDKQFDRKLKITSKTKIAKTISAFANTEGGIILIGVTDQNKIIGIDPEEEKYMVTSANEKFCLPPAEITFQEYSKLSLIEETNVEEELVLLLVIVEKNQNGLVYALNSAKEKKAYHRVNDRSLAL